MGLLWAFSVPVFVSAVDIVGCFIFCISICCGFCSINMSSMPILDATPEEMETDVPIEEVSVCYILVCML